MQNNEVGRSSYTVLIAIIVVCTLIEFLLIAADGGWISISRLRSIAYDYAGFWPGLLKQWKPNYSAQPYAMFVTYGFLHGGVSHLAVNMFTLWSIGRPVVDRVGTTGFIWLYSISILGGGLGFALLAPTLSPMVGASGALFGLVGGLLAWSYLDRFNVGEQLWPIARAVIFLAGLNLILWWAMDGQLAWETHLGGFVTGWIAALLIDPRPQ